MPRLRRTIGSAQRGKAIYRVKEVYSPIHHTPRGLRILVALPNMAGRKPFSDTPVPSFDRPYLVCQYGDYESFEYVALKWPAICRSIYRMGFTEIVQYTPTKEELDAERREETDEVIDNNPD